MNISKVHAQIEKYIVRTPVLQSEILNEIAGNSIYFKCENFQYTGSFKIRGASNAILNLSENEKQNGVVTHSSGNFAQALSLAAKQQHLPAYIVMPENAPKTKVEGVLRHGGKITFCAPTLEERERLSAQIGAEFGATFIHPSNDINVIQGQGTAAFELIEDYPILNHIFTPVGGGGLIAGTILAAKEKGSITVWGGEPKNMDDAYRSLQSGKIESNPSGSTTIADGLKTQLGDINFPILKHGLEAIITVSEAEIKEAQMEVMNALKIIIEPSSAVAFAAVKKSNIKRQHIGVILSGGNFDLDLK